MAKQLSDAQLAVRALEKEAAGKKPTKREAAALARLDRARDDQLRAEHYRTIPQRDWLAWSGRQARTVNEQARRYGIPFGGRLVSLPDVVRALHDFFSKHGKSLAELVEPGRKSEALEALRDEKARMARLDRLKREGEVIARQDVHEGLARIATVLRSAGKILQTKHGRDARAVLDEALDDCQREIDDLFA